jgi:uncharacterized protein YndB with AHSA1/START domain
MATLSLMTKGSEMFGTIANTGTIRFERLCPAPIERVWDYLTRPALLEKWLASGQIRLEVGGSVELHFALGASLGYAIASCDMRGVVTHCLPPHSLGYYITDSIEVSNVVFELERRGSEVWLLLTHAKLSKSLLATCGASWHAHLDILIEQLQDRSPTPFADLYERVARHYEQLAL